jgi:hypothetical protein
MTKLLITDIIVSGMMHAAFALVATCVDLHLNWQLMRVLRGSHLDDVVGSKCVGRRELMIELHFMNAFEFLLIFLSIKQ